MLQISLNILGGEAAGVAAEEVAGLTRAEASWLAGAEEWLWTAVCEGTVAALWSVVAGNGVSESWEGFSAVPCSSVPTENEKEQALFILKTLQVCIKIRGFMYINTQKCNCVFTRIYPCMHKQMFLLPNKCS